MNFARSEVDYFSLHGQPLEKELERTTHLAIAAHQDDVEIMALDGVLKCFQSDESWFSAVIATNGDGSPRDGIYANYNAEDMMRVRRKEQKKAAVVGEYASVTMLNYSSGTVKNPRSNDLKNDLIQILLKSRPQVIYLHNLADKHDTHVATAVAAISALREIMNEYKADQIFGCEVWRGLDWVCDKEKIIFDLSEHQNISNALISVFDSQIYGGKGYDVGAIGRRHANATFSESHKVDALSSATFGILLTEFVYSNKQFVDYTKELIGNFEKEVTERINRVTID